jgi:DNA-binding MarR family transcriptional regulator
VLEHRTHAAHSKMTARKPTNADGDNSGDRFTTQADGLDNDDAQELLEYLDDVGSCSIDELAGWSRLPHAYLKRLLRELEDAGLIESSQGYHEVRITATTASEPAVATDGGYLPGEGHADVSVDLSVGLDAADLYHVISNERRRRAIRLLSGVSATAEQADLEASAYIELGDLVDALIDADGLGPTGVVDRKRRNSLYNSLAQTHLPLLDELALITYHDRVQKIEPTPVVRETARVMDLLDAVAAEHNRRPDRKLFATLLAEGR